MTPLILQEELVKELNMLFDGYGFNDGTKLNVYEQQLPIIKNEDENEDDVFPYIIVRVETGTTKSADEAQEVQLTLVFGCCNEDTKNDGHKTIMGMIQRVYERFQKEPMLASKYMYRDPFQFALQDEESFPYYFGAASMIFRTAAIRREDMYS